MPAFGTVLANTVLLAGSAALVAGALALLLAYAARLHPALPVRAATRFAGMGYALPGSVIAVGILIPVAQLDHGLAALTEWLRRNNERARLELGRSLRRQLRGRFPRPPAGNVATSSIR